MGRRDTGEKQGIGRDEFVESVVSLLDQFQDNLFQRALTLRQENSRKIDSLEEFTQFFTPQNAEKPEIHGGFAYCHFVEDPEVDKIISDMKVTIRCVPIEGEEESGKCIFTGRPSRKRGLFAKAY
jgi:prolyl-tRNA synthetase